MKLSSKKLLFLLYPSEDRQTVFWPIADMPLLFPELSAGGRRSLIHWLKSQGWVDQVLQQGQNTLFLTQAGQTALEKDLPVFTLPEAWQGQWQILLFRQAPDFDPRFALLRSQALKNGALVISRGVYGFAGKIPSKLLVECQQHYSSHVLILETDKWIVGELRDIVVSHFGLTDLSDVYSRISKEIASLLTFSYNQKEFNHQSKKQIYSLYARFFANLCGDTGLIRFYFPQSPLWTELLADFHRLLRL